MRLIADIVTDALDAFVDELGDIYNPDAPDQEFAEQVADAAREWVYECFAYANEESKR